MNSQTNMTPHGEHRDTGLKAGHIQTKLLTYLQVLQDSTLPMPAELIVELTMPLDKMDQK